MTSERPPRTRAPVHAAAASPRGASHPRQEGPPDLRLVPPALATWAAAALALDASPLTVALACTAAALAAVALLLRIRRRAPTPDGPRAVAWRGRRMAGAIAASLLCGAVAGAVAGLHGADVRRGP
ncbi:hypothetical protein JBE27_47530, partial [Streptomyces albiflaviniger]|nr:hypothetical protein [Streptomyces albiflaviniger]